MSQNNNMSGAITRGSPLAAAAHWARYGSTKRSAACATCGLTLKKRRPDP